MIALLLYTTGFSCSLIHAKVHSTDTSYENDWEEERSQFSRT